MITLAAHRDVQPPAVPARLVVLTAFITPYTRPVLLELSRRVKQLTVLLSTPMEENRSWQHDWQSLDVRLQRTVTLRRRWRHEAGFHETQYLHIPWNTLGLLRRLRPDVIVSTELGFRSLFCACYCLLHPGVRLLLSVGLSEHTERGRGLWRNLLRRWLVRRADAVLVNGSSGQRYLERLGCDPRRIFRLPYTPAPESLYHGPAQRDPDAAQRLLYAGQLNDRKGVLPFVETLARWAAARPARRVQLTLVGSGPLEDALRATPKPANLSVEFLGERRPAEMAEIYARSGIFVLPTLADEWAMVVNEAMAAGLPVLGSIYSQAVEDLCVEGQTGWAFRPDRPGEMEQAIDRALNTPADTLHRMRVAARQCVASITPGHAADCMARAILASLDAEGD
jgi:glycosyltransferase involved in cell wall biosynthesis